MLVTTFIVNYHKIKDMKVMGPLVQNYSHRAVKSKLYQFQKVNLEGDILKET